MSLAADIERLLHGIAGLFAADGNARAVAVLALGKLRIEPFYDGYDGGHTYFTVYLELPRSLFSQVARDIKELEREFKERAESITRLYRRESIDSFVVSMELEANEQWREKAIAWLAGDGVTNQGRVRSNNIAPREEDGLLFRSKQEIHLYHALKSLGVSFAPLPVFIRGGEAYRRIEPDFVILKDGIVMVVEVDGDTVHTEAPVEAHDRTTMLVHEGAHVERVKATDCDSADKANACAKRLLEVFKKLKVSR
jgi:hypothetical protein